MDDLSSIAAVVGLAGCLSQILRSLPQISASNPRIEDPLRDLHLYLVQIQNGLRKDFKHARGQELLHMLQVIETSLEALYENVQNVDNHYRKYRLWKRFPWSRDDMEAAIYSILLAKDMIRLIKNLHGLDHQGSVCLDGVR